MYIVTATASALSYTRYIQVEFIIAIATVIAIAIASYLVSSGDLGSPPPPGDGSDQGADQVRPGTAPGQDYPRQGQQHQRQQPISGS